jgi:hypothetical protein
MLYVQNFGGEDSYKISSSKSKQEMRGRLKIDFREMDCEMDGTGSESCPVSGCGISGVEVSVSGTTRLTTVSSQEETLV